MTYTRGRLLFEYIQHSVHSLFRLIFWGANAYWIELIELSLFQTYIQSYIHIAAKEKENRKKKEKKKILATLSQWTFLPFSKYSAFVIKIRWWHNTTDKSIISSYPPLMQREHAFPHQCIKTTDIISYILLRNTVS